MRKTVAIGAMLVGVGFILGLVVSGVGARNTARQADHEIRAAHERVRELEIELNRATDTIRDLGITIDRLAERQFEIARIVGDATDGLLRASTTARSISDLIRSIIVAVDELEAISIGD